LRAAGQTADERGGLAGPILAALATVLYADTGTADVRVGMMIANRAHADVEHLIGYFVNIAVMRIRVDPGYTMSQLVASANTAVAAGLDNQEVPIQDVLRQLRHGGGLSDIPLYQVTLALNTMRTQSLTFTGVDCADLDIESFGPRLAPTAIEQRWLLEDRGGGLGGTLTYKTDTFTRAGVLTCLRNLDQAIRAVMTPHRTIAEVISKFEKRSCAARRQEP
jgi:non-ribosomal peptide synthetase component F